MTNLSSFRDWAKRLAAEHIGRRKAEITIENHRILVVRRLRSTRAWCAKCGGETDMIRAEDAATLARDNSTQLPDSAGGHCWHITQDRDGKQFVCLESILNEVRSGLEEI